MSRLHYLTRPINLGQRATQRFTLLAVITLVLSFSAAEMLRPSFQAAKPANGGSYNALKRAGGDTHSLVVPYYNLRDDQQATLMVSNQGPNEMPVEVRLFSRDGARFDIPAFSLAGHELRALNLSEYAQPGTTFAEGSLRVNYQGRPLELAGVVTMVDPARSLIFDEELIEPAKAFASARLEGLWWRPAGNSEVRLALLNTGETQISIAVTTSGAGQGGLNPVTLTLGGHESCVLSSESDNWSERLNVEGTVGGISVTHSGSPGSIVAYGFVQNGSNGFSNTIDFSDPHRAGSLRLDGAGLRVGSFANQRLSQIAVVRNISSHAVNVSGRITYALAPGGQGDAALPTLNLEPGEVKEIDLSPVISRAIHREEEASVGLEFTYSGDPGSILASAISISPSLTHVFRVPMRDATVQSSSTGIYPWSIDESSSTFVYIKNVTGDERRFTMSISFEGGHYMLGEKTIPAGQTLTYDIRDLRDTQRPDDNGVVIPRGARRGKVHWSARGPAVKPLIGRAEQVDLANGLSMTVACGICCQDSYYDSWISPGSVTGVVGSTTQFSQSRRYRDCYGFIKPSSQYEPTNWSCDDTSVATIDSRTGIATAVGPGSSYIHAPFLAETYEDMGSWCEYSSFTADPVAMCTVLPPCTMPSGETTMSTVWSGSRHNWVQRLLPAASSFAGRRVYEEDPGGGGPDDCYYSGSPIVGFVKITNLHGEYWTVAQSTNEWGPDTIGYGSDAVYHYRFEMPRFPCGTRFRQRMVIDCGNQKVNYLVNFNELRAGIQMFTVTSGRAAQDTEPHPYP